MQPIDLLSFYEMCMREARVPSLSASGRALRQEIRIVWPQSLFSVRFLLGSHPEWNFISLAEHGTSLLRLNIRRTCLFQGIGKTSHDPLQ